MPEIRAIKSTVIKSKAIDSSLLPSTEKFNLEVHEKLLVNWITEEDNHYKFELKTPVNNKYNWFAFKPDVEAYGINLKPQSLAQKVVNYMKAKNYELFTNPNECNLIGLEGIEPNGQLNKDEFDKWNDVIGVLKFDSQKRPYFECLYKGTTEPGRYYTVNPMNPRGAARLVPGQYKAWRLGLHFGKPALVQCAPLKIQRDYNKDGSRAGDIITTENNLGINIHRAVRTDPNSIQRWSAGCAVIRSEPEFLAFLDIVKRDPRVKTNSSFVFSYTLILASELK